ncbi:putative ARF guanine-nucleotide exchange factor GNOM-like protein [Tanacetum coccineum]
MTHVKDKLTNVIHLKNNEAVVRSLKLTLLIFVIVSISVIALSRRYPAPGCLINKNYQNTLDTIARAPDSSPEASEPPTDISHVLFGIGGSVHTWEERRRYSELWWQPGRTRGFVWLDENPDMEVFSDPNSPPFKVSEPLTLENVGSGPAVRIARIVLESFRLRLPDVRWFVMGDDDTVFFPENLISVLSKYDHRKMYYVGGSSESVEQDVLHSYDMAFGGGGFAISYPLAVELARIFDGCLDRYRYFYGSDQRVWACVSELGVSLTKERGFHQVNVTSH